MQNTSFPSRNSMHRARARRSLGVARGGRGWIRLTAILRVTVLHPAGAPSRDERCVPRSNGRRGDLGEPEIRRTAMPLTRFGRGLSIRARSAKARPRATPRRRRQHRKGAPFQGAIGEDKTATSAAPAQLLPGSLACKSDTDEEEDEKCTCDQKQCCHSSSKLAREKQFAPPLLGRLAATQIGASRRAPNARMRTSFANN